METEQIVTVIVAVLGSGVLGAWGTAWFNRRKTDASATGQLTQTALTLVERLEKDVVKLRADREKDRQEIAELRQELEDTKNSVEDLTAEGMKYQLAFLINTTFMQLADIDPPVTIEGFAEMTIRELRKMSERLMRKLSEAKVKKAAGGER